MPAFIPPGQGVTVTQPVGVVTTPTQIQQSPGPQAPSRTAAPPSPFRQIHGPDLVIMPHTEEKKQPQPQQAAPQPPGQPAQMGMIGRARRALKLSHYGDQWHPQWDVTHDPELLAMLHGFADNPHDMGHVYPLTDKLMEIGHPGADLFHWYYTHGLPTFMSSGSRGRMSNGRDYEDMIEHVHNRGGTPLTALLRIALMRHANHLGVYWMANAGPLARELEIFGLMPKNYEDPLVKKLGGHGALSIHETQWPMQPVTHNLATAVGDHVAHNSPGGWANGQTNYDLYWGDLGTKTHRFMGEFDHHFNPPNQTHGTIVNPPRTPGGERIHIREVPLKFPQKPRI